MSLVTMDEVKSWGNPTMDSARDEELERACAFAASWVPGAIRREIELASYVRRFNGRDAGGPCRDVIDLDSGHRPVVFAGMTITEDGVALTPSQGYSTTATVTVENAGEDRRCRLIRRNASWADGLQNIVVTYDAGWASAAIPERVKQLAREVAWRCFQSPAWIGKLNVSSRDHATTFEKELSVEARATLADLRVWW